MSTNRYPSYGTEISLEQLERAICNTLDRLLPAAQNYILEKKAAGANCDELAKNVVKLSLLTDREVDKNIIDLKSAMEIDLQN